MISAEFRIYEAFHSWMQELWNESFFASVAGMQQERASTGQPSPALRQLLESSQSSREVQISSFGSAKLGRKQG